MGGKKNDMISTRTQQLAQLALLAAQPEQAGACLNEATLAALVEGRLDQETRKASLQHIASCERCLQLWLQLDQIWQMQQLDEGSSSHVQLHQRKVLAITGSLLAVAASVAVFVTLTPQMMHQRTVTRAPLTSQQAAKRVTEAEAPSKAPPSPQIERAPAPLQSTEESQPEKKLAGNAPSSAAPGKTRNPIVAAMPAPSAPQAQISATPEPPASVAADQSQAVAPIMAESAKGGAPQPAIAKRNFSAANNQPQGEITSNQAMATSPVSLWTNQIRQGCSQKPASEFFIRIAREGRQLLASPSLTSDERQQVQQILIRITMRKSPEENCQDLQQVLEQHP